MNIFIIYRDDLKSLHSTRKRTINPNIVHMSGYSSTNFQNVQARIFQLIDK